MPTAKPLVLYLRLAAYIDPCHCFRRGSSATLVMCLGLVAGFGNVGNATAAPRVTFELVTEVGFPITGAQEWIQMFGRAGIENVRIRAASGDDELAVENIGSERSPNYRVTGLLTGQNTLRLPGGTFRSGDRAGIIAWIEKLQADGIEGLSAKTGAFGLTSKQLVAVHEQLSEKLGLHTQGRPAGEVVREIADSLPLAVVIDGSARSALAGDATVAEELFGLSCGTALAAVLRPLGLVMAPQRPSGGEVRLVIAETRTFEKAWPVGWPLEKPPGEAAPELFNFVNVEIENFVLADALNAIQQRVKVPFLYDHNSLARNGVDLTLVKVTLPKGKTYYQKIISRLLAKSKPQLTSELRADERGQPFLWITTLK